MTNVLGELCQLIRDNTSVLPMGGICVALSLGVSVHTARVHMMTAMPRIHRSAAIRVRLRGVIEAVSLEARLTEDAR